MSEVVFQFSQKAKAKIERESKAPHAPWEEWQQNTDLEIDYRGGEGWAALRGFVEMVGMFGVIPPRIFADLQKAQSNLKKALGRLQQPGRKISESRRAETIRQQLKLHDDAQQALHDFLIRLSRARQRKWKSDETPHLLVVVTRQALNAGAHLQRAIDSLSISLAPTSTRQILGGLKGSTKRSKGRDSRAAAYVRRYAELRKQRPKLLHVRATELVAAEFGVSGRTVRQYVKNPNAKRKRK